MMDPADGTDLGGSSFDSFTHLAVFAGDSLRSTFQFFQSLLQDLFTSSDSVFARNHM